MNESGSFYHDTTYKIEFDKTKGIKIGSQNLLNADHDIEELQNFTIQGRNMSKLHFFGLQFNMKQDFYESYYSELAYWSEKAEELNE